MDLVPALEEPLKKVLGPATAKVMAEHLGLHTVGDLLHHYPRRYEERGQLTHLADLPMEEHVTVVAQVADARLHTFASARSPRGKGQRLEVTITDAAAGSSWSSSATACTNPTRNSCRAPARCSPARSPSSTADSNWPIRRTSC